MTKLHIVGVDLAKRVFHLHGADIAGNVLFRKKLTRSQFEASQARQNNLLPNAGSLSTCIQA